MLVIWHWTGQKIRVHVSYCVTALAVAHLMRREAARAGLALPARELRTILLSAGLVLLLLGGASAVCGGAVMALFGSDNRLTSGVHRISTSTNALVTSLDDVGDLHGTADVVGSPTLGLQLTGAAKPNFVGIGPAEAVDRYLATATVETVRDLDVDPFRMRTPVGGFQSTSQHERL